MNTQRLLSHAILLLLAIVTLMPLASIFFASLHEPGSLIVGLSIPEDPHWENYAAAWNAGGFAPLIRTSLVIALSVVPLTLVLGTMAGYGLSMLRIPGRAAILGLFIAGLTIPIELVIIPLYFDLRALGLTNSLGPLVLAETSLFLPFSVFWMTTQFRSVPGELADAARVDGAGQFRMLWSVALPLVRPGLVTLGLLIFLWSWKQFLLVLVLIQDPALRTAPAGLGFFVGENTLDIPMLSAGTMIVILPVLVLYLVFQRKFADGLLQGAVKG